MNKGKIKTIPLIRVEEGQQVYWTGCPSRVKIWTVMFLKDDSTIYLLPYLGSPRAQSVFNPRELSKLVVVYEGNSIPDVSRDIVKKEIPLKDSEWRTAIKLGLVDSDESIMFKIVPVYVEPPDSIHCNRGADVDMAVFIPMESWDAVFERFNKMYPTFPFNVSHQEWLKANFKDPIPL